VWADVWAQRFRRDQLNLSSQRLFKKEREVHEIIKGLLTGFKLHKDIDITLIGLPFAHKRTEHTTPFHSELPYAGTMMAKDTE
jgi:hypothetical protein